MQGRDSNPHGHVARDVLSVARMRYATAATSGSGGNRTRTALGFNQPLYR